MPIAIIGAGNVATHLVKSFHKNGIQVDCIVSRNIVNAKVLANHVGAKAYSNLKKYKNWSLCDFVIIAVKDDAIDEVVQSGILKDCNILHTSGSYDSKNLKDYSKNFGAIYPFQTFRKTSPVNMEDVPVFVEYSNSDLLPQVIKLAKNLSPKVFELSSDARRKMHVSGVFINNFIYFILKRMKEFGNTNEIDTAHLMPLLQQTISNAFNFEENLQTGPAIRGDKKTIQNHVELLDNDKVLQKLYVTLSSLIYEEANGEKVKL